MTTRIYSDLREKGVDLVYDLESIYQSIHNILNTRQTERIFQPEFGSVLEDLLFELVDEDTAYRIYAELIGALSRWEPRVRVIPGQTKVVADPVNHNYEITVAFAVKGLSSDVFEYSGVITRS